MSVTREAREKRQHKVYQSKRQRLQKQSDSEIETQYFLLLARRKTSYMTFIFIVGILMIAFAGALISLVNGTSFNPIILGKISDVNMFDVAKVIFTLNVIITSFIGIVTFLVAGLYIYETRNLIWRLLIMEDEMKKRRSE